MGRGADAHLPGGFLLIVVALEPHLLGLHLNALPPGLGLGSGSQDLHLRLGLGLHQLPVSGGHSLGLEILLLPDIQHPIRKLLLEPDEVLVVVGGDDPGHIELGHHQAVILEALVDDGFEALGQLCQLHVDVQDVDVLLADGLGQIGLDLGHNHGPEKAGLPGDAAHGLRGQQLLLGQAIGGTHHLQQQPPGIADPQVKFASGPQLHIEAVERGPSPGPWYRCPT